MSARYCWDRKASAHAEIVNHLADAADDPVLALLLGNISGQLYDLMVTVGPASGAIIASSRYRLLALMRAGTATGRRARWSSISGACSGCAACPAARKVTWPYKAASRGGGPVWSVRFEDAVDGGG